MNVLDRAIAPLFPGWAAARAKARYQIEALNRAYDATHPGRRAKRAIDYGSGTTISRASTWQLRIEARDLERNHDLAAGALDTLVQNIVGANGIGIEPHPLTTAGTVHETVARDIKALYRDWIRRPEVSREHSWASAQRIIARSWIRDGEVLTQELMGRVKYLEHGTKVPFSLELIEADQLPLYYEDFAAGVVQGVERNAWGQPTGFYVLKQNPGDYFVLSMPANFDVKRIPASACIHLKYCTRIGQVRGISRFAPIITRLRDIKDYEESERVAAKVAASLAAVIIKGSPEDYDAPADGRAKRQLSLRAGMIFDNLAPGEDVKTIDSKRPNPNVENFRNGQLRASAAGVGVSYSSFAKHYDNNYSAQRQELIEQWGAYGVMADEFIRQYASRVYQDFVATALAAGALVVPRDLDVATLDHAIYIPPSMPWIDPQKEVEANIAAETAGYVTGPEIIRKRGGNPADMLEQEAAWRKQAREHDLSLITDPANGVTKETARVAAHSRTGV